MQSKINIANNALMRIGNTRFIESLTSAQNEAIVINRVFDAVRQRLIRRLPWPFARQVVTLGLTTKEIPGWRFCYRYPSQALRIFNVCGTEDLGWEWWPLPGEYPAYEMQKVDGTEVVATNKVQAKALIVTDVDDTSDLDPLFEDALIWALACEVAAPLAGSSQLVQTATDAAARAYDVARAASLSEREEYPAPIPEFVRARL